MSGIDIKCFGNQGKLKYSVIDLHNREDVQDLEIIHRMEGGHLSEDGQLNVNIKLSSIKEMNLAGYLTRKDLNNLRGSSRDFVLFRGADKYYLESKAHINENLKS